MTKKKIFLVLIYLIIIGLGLVSKYDTNYGNFFMTISTVTITLLSVSTPFIAYIWQQHSKMSAEIQDYIFNNVRDPLVDIMFKISYINIRVKSEINGKFSNIYNPGAFLQNDFEAQLNSFRALLKQIEEIKSGKAGAEIHDSKYDKKIDRISDSIELAEKKRRAYDIVWFDSIFRSDNSRSRIRSSMEIFLFFGLVIPLVMLQPNHFGEYSDVFIMIVIAIMLIFSVINLHKPYIKWQE